MAGDKRQNKSIKHIQLSLLIETKEFDEFGLKGGTNVFKGGIRYNL